MLGSFFNFDKFIAPILIKVVYWIGIVGIILGALLTIVGALSMLSWNPAQALGTILIALGGAAVGLLFWRVVCEVWIVLFSINDRLGAIAERGKM